MSSESLGAVLAELSSTHHREVLLTLKQMSSEYSKPIDPHYYNSSYPLLGSIPVPKQRTSLRAIASVGSVMRSSARSGRAFGMRLNTSRCSPSLSFSSPRGGTSLG